MLAHIHTYILAHIHTYILAHIYTYILAHIHTYILAHIHTYILAHIFIHTHAHIHHRKNLPSVTYMRMDGETPPHKRFDMQQKFNSDPTIDIMMLTTSVGGLGLTLTGADTVHYEFVLIQYVRIYVDTVLVCLCYNFYIFVFVYIDLMIL